MASAKTQSANEIARTSLVHAVQLKPTIKAGRMASIGISDVVTASVYSEKTHLKKLMMMKMIISIMNKLQETMVFHLIIFYVNGKKFLVIYLCKVYAHRVHFKCV